MRFGWICFHKRAQRHEYLNGSLEPRRDGMPLVPPKERFHFSAVRAEECGLSEEELFLERQLEIYEDVMQ